MTGRLQPSRHETPVITDYYEIDLEAAARLFDLLHEADASDAAAIAVAPIPQVGLGLAINDRLKRAATPR